MAVEFPAILVPPDLYAGLGVLLGSVSLALDLRTVRRGRSGQLRQQEAIDELKRRIVSLANGPNKKLISANHFRSLAVAIERERRCPVITSKLVAEAIRAAALEIEDNHQGRSLVPLLEDLNRVLVDLDQAEPPLLSLARVDRLEAYIKSQPYAVALLFTGIAATAVLAIAIRNISSFIWISMTLLAVELLFLYAAVRVEHYWSQSSVKPPRHIFNFFVAAMSSRSSWTDIFWDLIWGPIWENRYLAHPIRRHFIYRHMYRFGVAEKLTKRLVNIQRARDLAATRGQPPPNDAEEFDSLCRELWIVTGDDQFRRMEHAGELSPANTNGNLHALGLL